MITRNSQKGASLTEFIVVTPMIFLLGMLGVQYTLMYNAKSNLTYAGYEAARAGAIHHADPQKIQEGLLKGLLPYLNANGNALVKTSNGTVDNIAMLKQAQLTEAPFMKIEIISPNKQAFDDFNNPTLQQLLKTTHKVIPNKQTDFENLKDKVGSSSGLTIAEANVLKLRVTYGYKPEIPLAKNMMSSLYSFLMGPKDSFSLKLLATSRIPMVVDVSAQMLSPPVENGLATLAYNPGGAPSIPAGNNTLPNMGGVTLPPEYQGMTPDQILAKIISEGGTGNTNGGAGSIGVGNKSNNNWLAILIALGLVAAGSMGNNGSGTGSVTGDFLNPSTGEGNTCPISPVSGGAITAQNGNGSYSNDY
ncbi:hypothetical protein A9299_08180 [Moraxella osloensis]|uniref:TadE-like domain-containing protein n=1 Tax=Faucicola osloensis TaxID=34062 RepID=A0AA91FUI7_FAUOS|nr:TadE/TadG family type IV pilus assembly protein [Moraxella osloensis]OBX65578.1 hypothetical protein A9299_08180 [Moraxella osloensis]